MSDLVECVKTKHVRMTMNSAKPGPEKDIAKAKSTKDT